jgi:hypothetical protein
MMATVMVWFVATISYAAWYVSSRTSLPQAVGYERQWEWQLFFFALTRLPLLLVVLALVLWLEAKLLRGQVSS